MPSAHLHSLRYLQTVPREGTASVCTPAVRHEGKVSDETLAHEEVDREMTQLFAQPYDLSAYGFYFESEAEYDQKADDLRNDYGQPVEEFEIQFIDGEGIDCQLFTALDVSQCSISGYFAAVEEWDDSQKVKVIIAVGEVGYNFDLSKDDPDKFDVDLYECDTMRDLAMQFIGEGYFGDIPSAIANYLDYDAIGRDLNMDYAQAEIGGTRYIYRCD